MQCMTPSADIHTATVPLQRHYKAQHVIALVLAAPSSITLPTSSIGSTAPDRSTPTPLQAPVLSRDGERKALLQGTVLVPEVTTT